MAPELQSRIDQGINERNLPICDIRTRGDPWSPIFRLPPEVLENIFLHYARDYHEEKYTCRLQDAPSWVNVSYVCRRWRDVALHCPTLWTYHFVLSLRWTEVLLARSKQASLKIRMRVGYSGRDESWWSTLLDLLMKHAERIQELHLVFFSSLTSEKFSKLSIRSRRLQSLKIVAYPNGWNSDPLDLPTVLVEGETPALQKLKLHHCPVPWYSLSLCTLTTLDLFHIPLDFQKDTAEFLAILASTRDLVHLYLNRAISSTSFATDVFDSSLPRIHLPRLTRLFVAASFLTITIFLSCLTMPLETEVRLECLRCAEDEIPEDCGSLSLLLAHKFKSVDDPTSLSPTIRSLVIQFDGDDDDIGDDDDDMSDGDIYKLSLVFGSSERDFNFDRDCSSGMSDHEWDCKIPLKIDISTTSRKSTHIVSSICRSLPLENVQSVHAIQFVISPDFWKETLGQFPALQRIKLSRGGWPEIGSALSIPPQGRMENQGGDAGQQSDQSRIYGETLEELELNYVDCREGSTKHDQHWPVQTDLQPLWDALATRKTGLKFTMTHCGIYGGAETRLANLTGRWEGGKFWGKRECASTRKLLARKSRPPKSYTVPARFTGLST